MNLLDYFTDPILRAPTIGCMLMCVAASLMGVVLLLQRRVLVAESIAHAAYPGAIGGLLALAMLGPEYEGFSFAAVLVGALGSSWVGMKGIEKLERRFKIKSDAALCFILALFFGIGVLLASGLQGAMPLWVSQAHILLFGQAATLLDAHIVIYALLASGCAFFLVVNFRSIQLLLFDRSFSHSIGMKTRSVEKALFWLLLFSIIVGIRSVGVILMSGMLIAPAVAARQFSNRLKSIFILSAFIGAISGLIGNVLAVETALRFSDFSLPTGPMIVLVSSLIALFALLFSPKRGVVFRLIRLGQFKIRCLEENILKGIWKRGSLEREALQKRYPSMLNFLLFRLQRQGWIRKERGLVHLTSDGQRRAAKVVRLHRLWEVYLTEHLGLHAERVHWNAEEMEHSLTPELEERLTHLLSDPKTDPHEQPIPERGKNV